MEQEMMTQAAPQEQGRGTDTVMAHMSLGEVVIPRTFLDDPDVMGMLQSLFQQAGTDLKQYTVGDPANSINPDTGNPEFGFFSKLFKSPIVKYGLPLALSVFAPGIGTSLGTSLGLAEGAGASTIGNALIGAGVSAATGGGLKGALTGAVTGGLGANIGSLPGPLQGPTTSGAPLSGLSNGSGIAGALGRATGLSTKSLDSIGGLVGGSSGGGSTFNTLGNLASAVGGFNQDSAIKKQKQELLGANNQQIANLESFDPSGITSDPGYEFNREQGQQGLERGLAAQGGLFSGKALKAASEYNQNYADNAFKDYYQRWQNKVGAQNQLIGTGGDIRANATGAGAQNLAQSLSNAFGSKVGQFGGNTDLELLKRLGLIKAA